MTSTHKHHIIFIEYPPHKCLPEKSYRYCLRILIMSWRFKDPIGIMKEIMSWLFKDPINSGLAQFDHTQLNSEKWPKGWKDQVVPNESFSQKTTNKIFMYLLTPFTLKIFKKFFGLIQSYEHCHFRAKNSPFVMNKHFLKNINIIVIYLEAPFIVKKVLPADPELWGCAVFGSNLPISPN